MDGDRFRGCGCWLDGRRAKGLKGCGAVTTGGAEELGLDREVVRGCISFEGLAARTLVAAA